MSAAPVNLVVALPCEAAPLIERLRMRPAGGAGPVYGNDDGARLAVCGIGSRAAAAAVERLARAAPGPAAWLNVGIAGHRSLRTGEGVLAGGITEAATGRRVYPPPVLSGFPIGEVITVERPERDYPLDAAYEMEAFGFHAAAARRAALELVQCCKIVSDNPGTDLEGVTAAAARELIRAATDRLLELFGQLRALAGGLRAALDAPPGYEELRAAARLTETQRHRLMRLCRQCRALGLDPTADGTDGGDGRRLLRRLEDAVEARSRRLFGRPEDAPCSR